MKEGAWIVAKTGAYLWITEHALALQEPARAKVLGLPPATIEKIRAFTWDFSGPGRVAICLEGMRHGLIRFRGHGASVTLESLLPLEEVLSGAEKLMAAYLGPWMMVEVHRLDSKETWFALYKDIVAKGAAGMEAGCG